MRGGRPGVWFKRTISLFKSAGAGCVRDDTFGMGAALAFYTVFSLGPLFLIATVVAARLIGAEETQAQFVSWSERYFGSEGAKAVFKISEAVFKMIQEARTLRSGLMAAAVGLLTLFFGATGVFCQLKRSLNVILGAEPGRKTILRLIVHDRLSALAAAVGMGLVLFLGLLMSTAVGAVGSFFGRWLPFSAGFLFLVNLALSLVIVTPLFALIFRYLPDVKIPWRNIWLGAAVTAVLFQVGALLVGMYLGGKVLASVYGPAGSVLAVLLWAYYSAQTVLFGAEFTRAHAEA